MSPETISWELLFSAGYIVQPCRGLEPEAIPVRVTGSTLNLDTLPSSFFLPLFTESAEKSPIDISFLPEGGQQVNAVRGLVRSIAFDEITQKEHASMDLACRLAGSTYMRSGAGLFVVLLGRFSERARVMLWRFPGDESLQARMLTGALDIRLIQDAFSRESTKFKAAMFEGTPASTSFWKGRTEDRQAKSRVREVADFWVMDFLNARLALTASRGSRLLARSLRETIKKAESVEIKEALIAAAVAVKSQAGRNISFQEFATNYLPESVRPTFVKEVGGPLVAESMFQIEAETLDRELRFKSIVIDNLFIVRGPLDQFDERVTVEVTNEEGVVDVTLRGTITSQSILSR